MRTSLLAGLALLVAAPAFAQKEPAGREPGPRPVAAANDPVNRKVAAETADGLVVVVTIDGPSVRLDSATAARIPRTAPQRGPKGGDRVTAVGFAGGARVSEGSAADQVLNAQEGGGIVRLTKRQVTISLLAPRAIDTVEVSAPATGASGRLDTRGAYAAFAEACRSGKGDPRVCPEAQRR
jgi:hypothetical protein